ncbi:hypothetical protein A1O1_05697 [Capronia coronata CBS 617.96]|uniref:Choline transport protein n=1 Tax=Capronia coronata CBS 617.96 TaxID=1182541 RepID=W9XYQ4_9EURO|nr:uncharacterized protein A1O1_05697 [Capronia coronata CBS 617.96]EXJ85333.1 hypothetical protein A1O1_05697 [Capronia coronata CBS 617.96]
MEKVDNTPRDTVDSVDPVQTNEGGDETLSADEILLRAQGHKGELPRQFSSFAALSLAFVITNSWIGLCATFVTPLILGGGPMVFFGVLVAAVACTIITAGLAELASAYPSSGGQYHFAFMVSSVKARAAAAFVTGWLSTLAWCLTSTSASIFDAQMILALASFYNADFAPTQWQTYLIFLLITILAALVVCYAPRLLPALEKFFFWCSLSGFLVAFITMLAASRHKESAHVVFVEYNNQSGWSDGMSFVIAVGTCMYTFLATDATTHIAEEVPDPGRHIPRVMILTMVIGFGTVMPFILAILFSSNDLDAISASALPILEVYYQATGSKGAAAFFTFWILLNYFGATISCLATSGRLTWAFARDNGLPYSHFFARVHRTLETPINATFACATFVVLYGLIYIGSTTAFNSIINMSILALNVSYVVPQGILLYRGRNKVLPSRSFKLGPLGPFVNAFSCVWCTFYTIIFCFPTFLPAEVGSMNYVSVVVVGIIVIIAVLWYGGKRKTFVGPNLNFEGLEITQEHLQEIQGHGHGHRHSEVLTDAASSSQKAA